VQTDILARDTAAEFRVYAIWFNMYPGDDRSRWDVTLLEDARVTRLWDEQKIVGRWLVDQKVVDYDGDTLWDAYLLFGPKAIWDATLARLISWGEPVYLRKRELEGALSSILGESSPQI